MSTRPSCPECGKPGRPVKPPTIDSLVKADRLSSLPTREGFHFCATESCSTAYYHTSADAIAKDDVRVRIGVKETNDPRPLCYCFGHDAAEIAADARTNGRSTVAEEITAKCRQGLDRCEETNPRGACCLGDVRKAANEAIAGDVASAPDDSPRERPWVSRASIVGAIGAAAAAAACCVGPLIVALLGVGSASAMVALTPYRPYFLACTVVLLGLGFFWTYRRRPPADACGCETPKARRTRRRAKFTLWTATGFVLLLASSPYAIEAWDLSVGSESHTADPASDLHVSVIPVIGMDCPSCAVPIRQALDQVGGIREFEANVDERYVRIGFEGEKHRVTAYAAAIAELGYEVGTPSSE